MTDKQHKKYHHGSLKEELLDVALEMIEKEGFKTLSLRNIAKKAGVSHAAPYHHFSGKNDLLAAVAHKGFGILSKDVANIIDTEEDGPMRIKKMAFSYIIFGYNHPQLYRLMFSYGTKLLLKTDELKQSSLSAFNLLIESLYFSDNQIDVENVAMACWAMVHGLVMLLIDDQIEIKPSEDINIKIEQALEIMWNGVVKSL